MATGDNPGLPDPLLNGRKRVYFDYGPINRPTKLPLRLGSRPSLTTSVLPGDVEGR